MLLLLSLLALVAAKGGSSSTKTLEGGEEDENVEEVFKINRLGMFTGVSNKAMPDYKNYNLWDNPISTGEIFAVLGGIIGYLIVIWALSSAYG